jgi:hypothetical protein
MAKPTLELITALRATADRIDGGVRFQWAHMGNCNCGHLAQTLTKLTPAAIHSQALETVGDWATQCRDHCPDSGMPMDSIIETMVKAGLTTVDIANLERLLDDEVLSRVNEERKPLDHRSREDAVVYMRTWADLLEERWKRHIEQKQAANEAAPPKRELEET